MFDYHNKEIDALCTPHQLKILNAYRELGIQEKAAEMLGTTHSNIKSALRKIRKKANDRVSSLHDATKEPVIPEGYHVKGASSAVRNADGLITWIKTDIDKVKQVEAIRNGIESLTECVPVRSRISTFREVNGDDLANLYTFSDFHLGMLAWHKEGGDNWNLEIATQTLESAYSDMISRSPEADTCIINELGDWEHYTSMLALTPAHGNILDSDTRPEKMIDTSWHCMDHLIAEGLRHHNNVKVVIAQGNHNDFVSIARKVAFKRMYRNNHRVEFVDSQNPFYATKWGGNFLGFHHGHKVKPRDMPMVFAAEYRKLMGSTERTYIHCGHQHHKEILELTGAIVEMHRTLAAKDAHASYGGYHALRATDAITYHKDFGEFSRLTVYPHLYGDC